MASIPPAPAVCRRLDPQYHSLAASTIHPLPTSARWPVETSDLATQPPGRPSTGSHSAGPLGGPACLLALLLLAGRLDPSGLALPSPGTCRSRQALTQLPWG